MAPTRPSRAKENGTPAKSVDAAEAPAKRGRGRPPKNGISKQEKPAPSGRPRGRPPGSGGVKKATKPAKPKSTGTGGGRGRPRKSDASAGAASKSSTTPKSSKTKKPASAGKGRGKARKSDVAEEPEEEVEEQVTAEQPEDEEEDDGALEGIAMDDTGDEEAEQADAPFTEVNNDSRAYDVRGLLVNAFRRISSGIPVRRSHAPET
ncbi:hypothetical protein F4779DRAFT_619313 [Xylariaceae sp. FL0662B]|nr:hypothetical protein F4779DRAFT_619313 [Xylariaceae sp. FL0662B]